jgi:single-stranded-DNA-specific exonuclease
MGARWRVRETDHDRVRELARAVDLPEPVAALLVARGHADRAQAERHLCASAQALHDPALLAGMPAATGRIARALREGETILVHGDYDVDGVTGTALLMRLLRMLGAKAAWHVPNRLVDGYSFGPHSIARAAEVGATLVISVDNGTSAHAVIAELAERGVDVIVTDHHEPAPGELPPAVAILNPKLPGSLYPWRELCGGGVAFKLAWGLVQELSKNRRASEPLRRFLEEAMAFVAIATVCDVVPLCDENRVFARYGLKALEQSQSPGLAALRAAAGLEGRTLTAEDVAFQIGPRLNASGRLGSAEHAVELLLCEEPVRARELARELDQLNERRKAIEADVLRAARTAARAAIDSGEQPVLVLAGQGWHQGVVGIVAARLAEEFGRPAVVIGLQGERGRGSARSVAGFDVLAAIAGAAPHLERFGGHASAAGLEIRAQALEAARAALDARARELGRGAGEPGDLWIDYELPFPEMNPHLMRHLDRLEPFGAENEAPVLLSRDLRLAVPPRVVGADGSHLVLELRSGAHALKAMAFRMAHRAGELAMGRPLDAVYTPRWNAFRGTTSLELVLHDFRPTEA